jgi:ATP/maltotriose-dependent transcriptional regulator MalT
MKHTLDTGQPLEKEPGVFIPIENEEERYLFIQLWEDFKQEHVQRQRKNEYPPIADFADAWVKQDDAALEEYRQKCLAVKAKYPKPE